MKLIFFSVFYSMVSFVSTGKCLPRFHFWRPYFGEVSSDDFIAGTDILGRKSYIGKIIPLTGTRSWTQPTEINYDYAQFAWEDFKVRRIDYFMEIMAVNKSYRNRFQWLSVHSKFELKNIIQRTCLVEGGIVNYDGRTVIAYIGRTRANDSFYIGPVYSKRWVMEAGMHYMVGWEKMHRQKYYQILSYRPCRSLHICSP